MALFILSLSLHAIILTVLLYSAFLIGKKELHININTIKKPFIAIKDKLNKDSGVYSFTDEELLEYDEQQTLKQLEEAKKK